MRVLYLANAAKISGGNRVLLELWAGLGADATPIVACPEDGALVAECRVRGIECHVVPFVQPDWHHPLHSLAAFRRWSRLMRRTRVDLVHANDMRPARSILMAAAWHRVPIVCHVHFPPTPESIAWTFRGLPKPAVFLYCSHALADGVRDHIARAAPDARHHVVHNGLSLASFACRAREVDGVRRVIIVANLLPIKGHLDFIEMAHVLAGRGIGAEFWILGDEAPGSGYRDILETRVRELRLERLVQFLGRRSDVPDVLAATDVLVCASHVEPFGMCLLEAMACGKPVVATRVGGIVEVVADGETGFLVPPHAPIAMADAVERLLVDERLAATMGAAGRRRLETDFSEQRHVARTVAAYRDLLTGATA